MMLSNLAQFADVTNHLISKKSIKTRRTLINHDLKYLVVVKC